MDTIRTINEIFYSVVERNSEHAMLFKRKINWTPISAMELYRDVVGVARALESWGIGKGDRVAILSENRPEWAVADFATMMLGAASVPIYATLTAEQTLYLLRDSGARVLFVSTHDQLRKVMALKEQCALEKIVIMDYVGTSDVIPMQRLMHNGPTARDEAFDRRALSVDAEQIATIIYTSGTTGTPKGAMLTQGNLTSNILNSLEHFEMPEGQILVSFLPLSHVTARHLDYAMFWRGVTIAYCPYFDEVLTSMAEVRPTIFVAVPRVYEKLYNQVQAKVSIGLKNKIYKWAIKVGRQHKDEVLAGKTPTAFQWKLADRLFYHKVKSVLGGRAKLFISGGAPLNLDLIEWFACLGIRIYEGYGMTETSPVIALNNPTAYRAGSVGPLLSNVQAKIAEDGEILVKAPSVFGGYWNLPAESAKSFDGDWFRTGDIGRIDEEGFLFITDRKKDLIKTSGGKFVAPQPIEAKLKSNLLVAEAAIIGDRRKFVSVLVVPNLPALEDWAKSHGISWTSREQLVSEPQVIGLYKDIVAGVNENLAQFEKLKKMLLVADEFSIANGMLTPTMKVKRRAVEQRYCDKLEELYNTDAEALTAVANF